MDWKSSGLVGRSVSLVCRSTCPIAPPCATSENKWSLISMLDSVDATTPLGASDSAEIKAPSSPAATPRRRLAAGRPREVRSTTHSSFKWRHLSHAVSCGCGKPKGPRLSRLRMTHLIFLDRQPRQIIRAYLPLGPRSILWFCIPSKSEDSQISNTVVDGEVILRSYS